MRQTERETGQKQHWGNIITTKGLIILQAIFLEVLVCFLTKP